MPVKTFGFVSSVVLNAEIASWTQLATPEARHLYHDTDAGFEKTWEEWRRRLSDDLACSAKGKRLRCRVQ